jgi:hypothetical protein
VTRYPDRRRITKRQTHWPTALMLTAYLLAYAAGAYGLYSFIKSIADAVAAVAQ